MMTSYRMRKFATFNAKGCSKLASKKRKFSSALCLPKMSIFFLQIFYAKLYHTATYFFHYRLEMATAQRTRPRAVVGAPRRAAWQLKSALRHSISAAPRTKILYAFFYNYCW